MSFKFIHAADVHLDSPMRGIEAYEGAPVEEIRGATRRAFEKLVDLALEQQVAFVLLAGDLYDGDWKDYSTGLFFTDQMARLSAAGIRAFVIAGNHDAASQLTKTLRMPQGVHVFSTRSPQTVALEEYGVAVHGQGFANRTVNENLAEGYPDAMRGCLNIGLLHTSLDGRPGHAPYAPCSVDDLRARGYDYWALGHVHRREVVAEDPWIVFPGNLQGRHARETGPKGCSLVSVEDGRIESVEHRPLDVVRWSVASVDVGGAAALHDVLDRVAGTIDSLADESEVPLTAVRLQLTGACAANAELRAGHDQLVAECRSLANNHGAGVLWLEKVKLATTSPRSRIAALEGDDAFGGLLRSIETLELDEDRLQVLSDEVGPLLKKLRADLPHDDDAIDLHDSAFMREMLDDVKELLIARLLSSGHDA